MRKLSLSIVVLLLGALVPLIGAAGKDPIHVLWYSGTYYGFRHPVIEKAYGKLSKAGATAGIQVSFSEDPQDLEPSNLAHYDVLYFMDATGDLPVSDEVKQGIIDFVREKGRGFVAISGTADSNYGWPEFRDLVGAYPFFHPHLEGSGEAINIVEDPGNALLAGTGIPKSWAVDEEYYNFPVDPRPNVHVLTAVDNASIQEGAAYPEGQPTNWCQAFGKGRSFFSGLGHGAAWDHPEFVALNINAIKWAAGRLNVDCSIPGSKDRLDVEWADGFGGARREASSEWGADQSLTDVRPFGWARFDNVDLDGVKQIELHVSGRTEPRPYWARFPLKRDPALGGRIDIYLQKDGANVLPAPPGAQYPNEGPKPIGTVDVAAGSEWQSLTADIDRVRGVHDLVLSFRGNSADEEQRWLLSAGAPEQDSMKPLFSISWVKLLR